MTQEEVMTELRSSSNWNKARATFSAAWGRLDQEQHQRQPCGPIEIRRMEFEAVKNILAHYGLEP